MNARTRSGRTALHLCCQHIELDGVVMEAVMRNLIGRRANVNAQDEEGKTPLHFAMWKDSRLDLTETLLEAGVDREIDCHTSLTPYQEVVRTLTVYGFPVSRRLLEFITSDSADSEMLACCRRLLAFRFRPGGNLC